MAANPPAPHETQDGRDEMESSTSRTPIGVISVGESPTVDEEYRADSPKRVGGENASSPTAASITPEAEPEGPQRRQQRQEDDRADLAHASDDGAGTGASSAADTVEPQDPLHEEERGATESITDRRASGEGGGEDVEVFFSTGEDVSSGSGSSQSDSSEGSDSNTSSDDDDGSDNGGSDSDDSDSENEDTEKRVGEEEKEGGEGEEELVYGCSHYRRKCKIVAPCCGKVFWCRHCHNEESEKDIATAHEIDRHAVDEIICAVCQVRQPVSNTCIKCQISFGNYFCSICKFWDDQGQRKKVYHCDECGICRAGGRDKFFHCPICGSCYPKQLQNKHKCLENAMRRQCPVCLEDMFSSLRQSQVLMCGHTIHSDCLRQLQRQGGMQALRCPMCSKSIADFSGYWQLMREEIRQTPLDAQFQKKIRIVCNDCLERCVTDFHFVGLMCTKCNGFNTRIVEES